MGIGYQKEIDNNPQSQTSALFQYLLMNEQKIDIALTSPITKNDEVIRVSAGHGFTGATGEHLVVRKGDAFEQLMVTGVSVNDISIEMPIANSFPMDSTIIRGNVNMNIDGVSVPTDFKFILDSLSGASIPIDISTVLITMQHKNNVPDDGKFGGLAALNKGVYFRKINGFNTNLGNYATNQEFKNVGAVVEYTDKAPAGTNGTNIFIEIEKIFGQVIRLDPRLNDGIIGHVRDLINDTAGMEGLTAAIIGSFTKGE